MTPSGCGIGLRAPHVGALLSGVEDVAWLEVLSDNVLDVGGVTRRQLQRLRASYPLSLHGVGLSLGGTDRLDRDYLTALRQLQDQLQVSLVSDHCCFTSSGGHQSHDLLPLPFTEEALDNIVHRIDQVQERLGQRILVENVSAYVRYRHSTIDEGEFLSEMARRADCLLLLDVNNAYVNQVNNGVRQLEDERMRRATPASIPKASVPVEEKEEKK